MIELNKKAKKYNPCEKVLGLELTLLGTSAVVGSAYYNQEEDRDIKDILLTSHWSNRARCFQLLLRGHFEEQPAPGTLEHLGGELRYFKRKDGCQVFFTPSYAVYKRFLNAMEVCKYLKQAGIAVGPETAYTVADIVLLNAKVKGDEVIIPNDLGLDEDDVGHAALGAAVHAEGWAGQGWQPNLGPAAQAALNAAQIHGNGEEPV